MKGTAGQIMFETLKNYGVMHIFGMDDPAPLYIALDRSVLQPITVKDEKHGAIMAHGYAKSTGKPGVCAAFRGPGTINILTGLAEALKSSVPVIAITEDLAARLKGKNAASEFETEFLLKSVTKWVGKIDSPHRVAEMIRRGFRIATTGRPGPVALLCSNDIMQMETEADPYAEPECHRYPAMRIRANRAAIAAGAEMLSRAKKPVIIAGGGCLLSEAWNEVVRLAEAFQIPVATTLAGKGTIPETHPLSIGVMGSYTGGKLGRGKIANQIVSEADLAFIIGSRTDQAPYLNWELPKKGTRIIHLDVDPEEIGRNFKTDVALLGDVKETLADFMDHCIINKITIRPATDIDRLQRLKSDWLKLNEPRLKSKEPPIRGEVICKVLSNFLGQDTIVVADASYAQLWVMSHNEAVTAGRNFISPRGLSGVGWGLPAAIGAKLGNPDKTVYCLTGDGGFGYVMNELETAARYNVKITTVVFNNSILGFQKHWEKVTFGKTVECDLMNVDYSKVAKALGCLGERVEDPNSLKGAFERASDANKPYVIDVVIDPNSIPPAILFDGFNG